MSNGKKKIEKDCGRAKGIFEIEENQYSLRIVYRESVIYKDENHKQENHILEIIDTLSPNLNLEERRAFYFQDISALTGIFFNDKKIKEELGNNDYKIFLLKLFKFCEIFTATLPLNAEKNNTHDFNSGEELSLMDVIDFCQKNPTTFKVILLFSYYPQFLKDIDILKNDGYIVEVPESEFLFKWEKSNQCLTEYFHEICPKNKKMNWVIIEEFFNKNNLKNSFNASQNKHSKNFEHLKKLLDEKKHLI